MTSSDPESPADADDDDFTDIELAELDDVEPDGATEGAAPDDRLRDAHERAGQLRSLVGELGALDDSALAEHVDWYQRTHAVLQRSLSDIDNS